MSYDINDFVIKPEELRNVASQMETKRTQISNLMEQAKAEVTSLTGIHFSEAADTYQNRFKMTYDDIDSVLEIVQGHINGLNAAAGIGERAITAAKAEVEGVPTEGVS